MKFTKCNVFQLKSKHIGKYREYKKTNIDTRGFFSANLNGQPFCSTYILLFPTVEKNDKLTGSQNKKNIVELDCCR